MKAQLRTILAAVLLVAIPEVHAAVWTGAFVFLCNDRGDASTWVWDTRPGGQLNNISIAAPTHGGWKLMNGPDDYHASINIPLRPGTNVFAISGQGGPPNSAHAAINLFLDSKIAPSISAKRLLDGSFTANSSSNTLDMNATGASAAGVLAYDNGLEIA